jgi:hypothetical protein
MWIQGYTKTPSDVAKAAFAYVVKDKAEAEYARSDFFDKRRKLMESWAARATTGHSIIARIA